MFLQPAICKYCHQKFSYSAKCGKRREVCDQCRIELNLIKHRKHAQHFKGAYLTTEQIEYLEKNYINFSKFVRIKIDELINKHEQQDKGV